MGDDAAGAPPVDALLAFALGTWHAALLLVALALALHLAGATQGLFSSLGTAVGLAIGALLWGLSWWTTRQALDGLDPRAWRMQVALARGMTWGAATGGLFVTVVVVAAAVVLGEPFLLAVLVLGGLASIVAGALVGAVAALLDAALLGLARRLSRGRRSP